MRGRSEVVWRKAELRSNQYKTNERSTFLPLKWRLCICWQSPDRGKGEEALREGLGKFRWYCTWIQSHKSKIWVESVWDHRYRAIQTRSVAVRPRDSRNWVLESEIQLQLERIQFSAWPVIGRLFQRRKFSIEEHNWTLQGDGRWVDWKKASTDFYWRKIIKHQPNANFSKL